jgi:3-hydroxy-9,10-secoandrosta-1,3,5(10)-triene-9,17-dione monooxygenase reductase component
MLGQFATGVAIITTVDDAGGLVGVTCNSFTSVSLEPPLILWSIAKSSLSGPSFSEGKAFAVNVLEASQEVLAMRFAKTGTYKFADVAWHEGLEGVPLLEGCVAYMECRVDARYPGGDHEIILGAVERYVNMALDPLLFHSGEFRRFS